MADSHALVSDGLATIREAQAFLSVARSALYRLMDAGALPYVKLGAARRIPRRALIELAARNLILHLTPDLQE